MPIDFTAPGDTLKPLLERVRRVVETRATIPILANVRIEAGEDGRLTLRATDLDIEASVTQNGITVHAPGAVTVPTKLLFDIARSAKGPVRLTDTDDGRVSVTTGRASFALNALPAEDFPDITGPQSAARFSLEPEALQRIASCVGFAISTEETRYYLNGVYLHRAEDGAAIVAVATDGHRLSRLQLSIGDLPEFPGIIVPRKMVSLLEAVAASAKAGEAIEIAIDDARIGFETAAVRFISKLIDGTFPDYQRVVPAANPHKADMARQGLADAIQTVTTIASDRGRGVRFAFDPSDGLTLSVKDPEAGTAEDRITCGYAGDQPLTIGFNGRYVRDALETFESETIEFHLADSAAPTLLTDPGDPDRLVVLMPMRVE